MGYTGDLKNISFLNTGKAEIFKLCFLSTKGRNYILNLITELSRTKEYDGT